MDHTESVQIEIEQSEQMARLTPTLLIDPVQAVQKQCAIRKAGERVVKRFQKQSLLGLVVLLNQPFSIERL